ncbi:MAG TPA: sulfurtransferase, partial [Alteromonas sp.]|nr:sulfurtransferase [Alteromonas sp.]
RAGIALETLTNLGFEQLYHLDGDMQAWQSESLPVEQ